jgi:hypothetical protein
MGIKRLLLIILAIAGIPKPAAGGNHVNFEKLIAPILESRCLRCHNDELRKGKLSLATREEMMIGGKHGAAVVAGNANESLLVRMISGPAAKMPKDEEPLAANQIEAIKAWIDQDATWPGGRILEDRQPAAETWWSLGPLNRPAVPIVNSEWVRTPIDAFIWAKAQSEGLTVSDEADPRTLIRRVTFDLIGLPPTPEEVAAFVDDSTPQAYEKLVDRLLDSPRYGERWGRHWLDVVHYADTHGYDKDKRRDHAWPYRDYVIRAFNEDKPYKRFVAEQLAGDMLFPEKPDAVVATGFIAAGPWDFVGHVELREGTIEKAKTRSLDRDDMVATTASTFSSMTVHCARCHDHKFDPMTQADYYAMQAVFAGVDRGDRPYASPNRDAAKTRLENRKKEITQQRDALTQQANALTEPELKSIDEQIAQLNRGLAGILKGILDEKSATNGYHSGIETKQDVAKWVQLDLGKSMPIEAIRLVPARPVDFPDTPGFGFPARFKIEISNDVEFGEVVTAADHTKGDFKNPGDDAYLVMTESTIPTTGRYVRVTATKLWPRTNDFVFALAEMQVISNGRNAAAGATTTALDTIDAGRWHTKHLTDGFNSRNKLADLSIPVVAAMVLHRDRIPARLRELERERKTRFDALLPAKLKADLKGATTDLAQVNEAIQKLPAEPMVYAARSIDPRPIHLLIRGDVKQQGEPVEPGAIGCVAGLPARFEVSDPKSEADRRVALAQWIVADQNVLTWRSIVNRIWHYHFGQGIASTPNDFGRNGAKPTHPELLDWLAVEFRDNGGSIKDLHRLILRSNVYRQASADDSANSKIDASNRYLWRMNRRRLEAEAVRDAVLAASGQLNLKMGGPGFDLFDFEDDHSPRYDYVYKDISEAHRRSIYRFVVRSVPDPFMDTLDCADPNVNVPVRNKTITALQALALLNNPFVLRQSEYLAERVSGLADSVEGRIDAAYELALSHQPTNDERDALSAHAKTHGLANACRILFNANEFLFID